MITTPDTQTAPLLHVQNLSMTFEVKKGMFSRQKGQLKAVDQVSFDLLPGETLGLVGESGCGKTTIGRCLVRVYKPTSGSIDYRRPDNSVLNLATAEGKQLPTVRREVRMVFQDPHSSLNPRMTLRDIVGEPLQSFGIARRKDLNGRVAELLERVGLRPEYMRRYPHAFSGGERQRVCIARALATNPRILVADEPVSALDVSVRAQIINLMRDLQQDMGLTYLFISHDLSVVEHICDRVAVMYLGRLVELADTADLFARPRMPYTESLLSAAPIADPHGREQRARIMLEGEVPDPANAPAGCAFHTRCRYAQPRCSAERPELRAIAPRHWVACHFAEELELRGVAELTKPAPGA